MNLIDSSAWIAYFTGEKNAQYFEKAIKDRSNLLVPTIVIHEVFKKILREKNKKTAIKYTAQMTLGNIVALLDLPIALSAATIALEYNLAMADSIILATAQSYNATLWTQDIDFKKIPGVKFFKKT